MTSSRSTRRGEGFARARLARSRKQRIIPQLAPLEDRTLLACLVLPPPHLPDLNLSTDFQPPDVNLSASLNAGLHGINVGDIIAGVDGFALNLEGSLEDLNLTLGQIPVIGAELPKVTLPAINTIEAFRVNLDLDLESLYANVNLPSIDIGAQLQGMLFDVFGPNGLNILLDGPDSGNTISSSDVYISSGSDWEQFNLHIGQSYHVDLPFDLSAGGGGSELANLLPGLNFQVAANNGIRAALQWDLNFGFGFTTHVGTSGTGLYFDSGARNNITGDATPELSASVNVFAAPPEDAAGNDIPSNAPGLQASAQIGLLEGSISDGTARQVQVTSRYPLETICPEGYSADFNLLVTTPSGTTTYPISVSPTSSFAQFIADLNTSVLSKVNVSVTPEFVNAKLLVGTTPAANLIFLARDPDVTGLAIQNGDEMGFDAGTQYEDGRSMSLGFADGQTSSNGAITATLPAPPSGLLSEDTRFSLLIGGTTVPVVLHANLLDHTIGGLASGASYHSDQTSLQDALKAAIDYALSQSGLPTYDSTVTLTTDGRFTIALEDTSHPSATIAFSMFVSTTETTDFSITASVDLVSPKYDPTKYNAADENTYNRLYFTQLVQAKKNNTLASIIVPQISAAGKVRLHTTIQIDTQSVGIGGGSMGMPGIDFDLAWDFSATASYDLGQKQGSRAVQIGDVFFNHVEVNTGQIVSTILTPIVGTLGQIVGPLSDIIGPASTLLNKDLTVVDYLRGSGPNSIASLLPFGSQVNELLDTLDGIAHIASNLKNIDLSKPVSLGDWEYVVHTIDPATGLPDPLTGKLVPSEVATALDSATQTGAQFLQAIGNLPGFHFDLFDPSNIEALLSGQTFRIMDYGLPAGFQFSKSFDLGVTLTFDNPIASTQITVSGSVGLNVNLQPISLVYDSTGLAEFVAQARAGRVPNPTTLLDGVYITVPASGHVLDVGVSMSGSASAVVGLKVQVGSGSISAGLSGDVYLDLLDPGDNDGKLRLNEIFAATNNFSNPAGLFSLFNVGASLSANFSFDLQVSGIDLDKLLNALGIPTSYSISAGLSTSEIFGSMSTPAPQPLALATAVNENGGTDLVINAGPLANQRKTGNMDDSNGYNLTVSGHNQDVTVTLAGHTQTYTGNYKKIVVLGSPGDDTIDLSGLSGLPAVISGGGGNDVIKGGGGGNTISTGDGNVKVVGGSGNDVITGGAGQDTITLGNGNNTVTAGTGQLILTDGAGNDTIDASASLSPLLFTALDGQHTIIGSSNGDTITLGNGTNTVTVGAGGATIDDGTGNNTIDFRGSSAPANFTAKGNDTIYGSSGDDVVNTSGNGAVTYHGGAGNATLTGGAGNDTFYLGSGDNTVITGGGDNTVVDGAGSDTIDASANATGFHFTSLGGRDVVIGSAFDDTLASKSAGGVTFYGMGGNDTLTGGPGSDYLDGGTGTDSLSGGGGNDTLIATSSEFGSLSGGSGTTTYLLDATALSGLAINAKTVTQGTNVLHYNPGDIISVALGSGDDNVSITNASAYITIDLGDGNNTLTATNVVGLLNVTSGSGNDTITAKGINGPVTLSPGTGTNTINVSNVNGDLTMTDQGTDTTTLASLAGNLTYTGADNTNTLNASLVSGTTTITAGSGEDTISLSNATGLVAINSGSGRDGITLTGIVGPISYTGSFTDTVNPMTFTASNVQGNITAGFGNGKNNVSLTDVTGDVAVTTGNGPSTLTLTRVTGTSNLTTGSGVDTLSLTDIAGPSLTWTDSGAGGSGNQFTLTNTLSDALNALTIATGGASNVAVNNLAGSLTIATSGTSNVAVTNLTGSLGVTTDTGSLTLTGTTILGPTTISANTANASSPRSGTSDSIQLANLAGSLTLNDYGKTASITATNVAGTSTLVTGSGSTNFTGTGLSGLTSLTLGGVGATSALNFSHSTGNFTVTGTEDASSTVTTTLELDTAGEQATINLGSGNDHLILNGGRSGVVDYSARDGQNTADIYGQTGTATITLGIVGGSTNIVTDHGNLGILNVNGVVDSNEDANTTLVIDRSSSLSSQAVTFTQGSDTSTQNIKLGSATVHAHALSGIEVDLGSASDSVKINSTSQTIPLAIYTGDGNDTETVKSVSALTSIFGAGNATSPGPGNDALTLSIPGDPSAASFSDLTFDVNTLTIDNSGYASAVAWTYQSSTSGSSTPDELVVSNHMVVNTAGAAAVRLNGGSNAGNTLTLDVSSGSASQQLNITNSVIDLTQAAKVLSFRSFTQSSSPVGWVASTASGGTEYLTQDATPFLTQVSPNTAIQNSYDLTINVLGANFNSNSQVMLGSTAVSTTFLSTTWLQATIRATSLTSVRSTSIKVTNNVNSSTFTSGTLPFTVTAETSPNIPLNSTGVNLADGAVDPNWTVSGGGYGPRTYVASGNWIYPTTDPSKLYTARDFTYSTTLDLTGYDPSTVVLRANVNAQGAITSVLLNGVSVDAPNTSSVSEIIDSGFLPGLNTLTFVEHNAGSSTNGIKVDFTGTTGNHVSTGLPLSSFLTAPASASYTVPTTPPAPQAGSLTYTSTSLSGVGTPKYVTFGDFNGDGKEDLASVDTSNHQIDIQLGNGDGTFQSPSTISISAGVIQIMSGDLRNDGIDDLVVLYKDHFEVYLGHGDGTFGSVKTTQAPNYETFFVGELSNLGGGNSYPDLIVGSNYNDGNTETGRFRDYHGNGNGTFQSPSHVDLGTGELPLAVSTYDLNGDGTKEILGLTYDYLYVIPGASGGMGTFQDGFSLPIGNGSYSAGDMAVADLNQNGKADVLINSYDDGEIYQYNDLFTHHSSGHYTVTWPAPTYLSLGGANRYDTGLTTGDFNNDGWVDAAASFGSNIIIYTNSNGTLQPGTFYSTATPVTSLVYDDLDSDGYWDLIGGSSGTKLNLLLTGGTTNSLSSISPTKVARGPNGTVLTLTGTGFTSGSLVYWNGSPLTPTYVNPETLSLVIPEADVDHPGSVNVWVQNPSGAITSSFTFTINDVFATSVQAVSPAPGFIQGVPQDAIVLGSFVENGGDTAAAEYAVTIDWGDGSTSTGFADPTGNNQYNVIAKDNHVYSSAGTFTIKATLQSVLSGNAKSFSLSVTAAAETMSLTANAVTTIADQEIAATVATFSDMNPYLSPSDYTATIDWGDGSTSSGVILGSGGAFSVIGSHLYATSGDVPLTVTVQQGSRTPVGAASTAYVNPAIAFVPNAWTVDNSTTSFPNSAPASVPRFTAFSPNGNFLAVIDTANTLNIYTWSSGGLQLKSSLSGIPADGSVYFAPDGVNLYILSPSAPLVNYTINSTTGALTLQNTYGVSDVTAMVVSSDGAFAYVATTSNKLIAYQIQSGGALSRLQTLTGGTGGVHGLNKVSMISISADDASLYAGSTSNGTLASFSIDGTGNLSYDGVINNSLAGLSGITSTSSYVFALLGSSNTLSVFSRDADGTPTFIQSLREGAGGATGLENPTSLGLVTSTGGVTRVRVGSAGDALYSGGIVRYNIAASAPAPTTESLDFQPTNSSNPLYALTVDLGSGSDVATLSSVSVSTMILTTGSGDDEVSVLGTANGSSTNINLGDGTTSGNDVVSIYKEGKNATVNATVNPSSSAASSTFNLYSSGNGSSASTTLTGGSGTDTFFVDGRYLGSAVTIHGNPPTTTPGDVLHFNVGSDLASPSNPPTPGGSVYDATTNKSTVTYNGIESVLIDAGPTADAGGSYTISQGDPLSLSSAGSQVPSGHTATFGWSFDGDGNDADASGQAVSLSWNDLVALGLASAGTHTVTLRVTTDQGYSAFDTATITVNAKPVFTTSIAATGTAGSPVSLTLGAADPNPAATISLWSVDWGDGETDSYAGNNLNVSHVYALNGAYAIVITAVDDNGTFTQTDDTAYSGATAIVVPQQSVTIAPATLAVSGDTSVTEGSVYTLSLNDAGIDLNEWQVNWGDSSSSTVGSTTSSTLLDGTVTLTHVYTVNASWTITSSVYDFVHNATLNLNSIPIAVGIAEPTVSVAAPASVEENSSFTLTLDETEPAGVANRSLSWTIDWGDGTQHTTLTSSSSVNALTHTYASEPTGGQSYAITVTASDGTVSLPVNSLNVNVFDIAPTLSLSGGSSATKDVAYTLNLATVVGSDPVTGTMDWGDGSSLTPFSSTDTTATHTYTTEGAYNITASLNDDDGSYSSQNAIAVGVVAVPPIVAITGPAQATEGAAYSLALSGVLETGSDPITSWTIDWGDGSTSTVIGNPDQATHVYTDESRNIISATANTDFASFAATSNVYVQVVDAPPTSVQVSGPSQSVVEGNPVNVSLSAIAGYDPILDYVVNWGDGTTDVVTTASAAHIYAGVGTWSITAAAQTSDGLFAATPSLPVTITPAPPAVAISGASNVDQGAPYFLDLGASLLTGDTLASWTIDWGDGSAPQQFDPTTATVGHVYLDGGIAHQITATATKTDGALGTATQDVSVNDLPPVVSASGYQTVFEGSTYTLDLSASDIGTQPSEQISGWTIDWGDGNVDQIAGNPSSVTHVYANGGPWSQLPYTGTDPVTGLPVTYLNTVATTTPTIQATAFEGSTGYAAAPVSVGVLDVSPTIDVSGDSSVNEGSPYVLDFGEISDPGTDVVTSCTIDWGDGNVEIFTGDPTSTSHSHVYDDNLYQGSDQRTIQVSLTDNDGTHPYAGSISTTVLNVAPTADLSASTGITYGTEATATLGNPFDPSSVDTADGLRYAFSIDTDTTGSVTYADASTVGSASFGILDAGTHTVFARIIDKDGGFNEYATPLFVNQAPLTVTGITADNKVYDATSEATLNTSPAALAGLYGEDVVTLDTSGVVGTFVSKDVANGITVDVSGLTIGGAQAGNYTLIQPTATASITPAPLTASIIGDPTRTYDGTTAAMLTSDNFSLSGLVPGESFTVTQTTGSFNSAHVATATTVTASLSAVDFTPASGTLAIDYTLPITASGTGSITPAPLTITADSLTKTYGQSLSFGAGDTRFTTAGLQDGDTIGSVTLAVNGGAAPTSPVGNYTITPDAATGGTFTASDYTITYAAGTLHVAPASLTVTACNQTKTYGQAITFAGTEFAVVGLVNGDTVTSVALTSDGAAAPATVGSYAIVPSNPIGTGLTNYDIHDVHGTLTVTLSPSSGPSIFVLDATAGGALTMSGNAAINVGGYVVVDSNASGAIKASGNAQITAAAVQVVGGVSTSGKTSVTRTGTPGATGDPLAGLSVPTGSGTPVSLVLSGYTTATIDPGIYSQITVSGKAVLTMNPGVYVIEGGGFTVSGGASVSGSGVTIYNTKNSSGTYGSIVLTGNGTLTPATSGQYSGILIFQDRSNPKAITLSGNVMEGMGGTIYAAEAHLVASGNAQIGSASHPVSIVVDTMTLSGNAVANSISLSSPTGSVAYGPARIQAAYGVNNLALDGNGQTIAIVDAYDNPDIFLALDAFDNQFGLTDSGPSLYDQYGLASSFLTVLNQSGQPTSLPTSDPIGAGAANWELEEALDVEWTHAMAPGAQIVLVEASSQSLSDLMAAVATAAGQPGVSVVSMSWGFPEAQSVFAADEAMYDHYFNVPGVTFVASTGDYGAADPEYPAYSPNVVAVGGTSLTLNADHSYNSETGWGYYSDAAGTLIGSGGGLSLYEPEPAYQRGIQSTGSRTTPDVSLVADPMTGAWIADPYNLDPSNPFEVVGGTSLSAPAWAGLLALVNEGRLAAGVSTLNNSSPIDTQQALYMLPQGDYNAIDGGNNGYTAGAGYNLVTGLGTPVASRLVPDLVAYAGPGTTYPGATVGPLQDATLDTTGLGGGGEIDVFSVFDALTVNGRDPGAPGLHPPAAGALPRAASTPAPSAPDARAAVVASATGRWAAVGGPWAGAAVPTNSQALAGPLDVIRISHGDSGRGPWSTGSQAVRVLDSALSALSADADRSRGDEADGTGGIGGQRGAGDVEGGAGPERIRSDRLDPTGLARPVGDPPRIRPARGGPIPSGSMPDASFDKPAADAIGWPGGMSVRIDPIARPGTSRAPVEALPRLAAILILTGSWSRRACFRDVTTRRAGSPCEGKASE